MSEEGLASRTRAGPLVSGDELTLRCHRHCDDKLKDNYCVIHEGRWVGWIMLASERSWQGSLWEWHVPPASDPSMGATNRRRST